MRSKISIGDGLPRHIVVDFLTMSNIFSVSCSNHQVTIIDKYGLSPSKLFQKAITEAEQSINDENFETSAALKAKIARLAQELQEQTRKNNELEEKYVLGKA